MSGRAAPKRKASPGRGASRSERCPHPGQPEGRERPGKDGNVAPQNGSDEATAPAAAPADAAPQPADDKSAQQEIKPEKIVPVTNEKGTRRDKAPDTQAPERPKGADVLAEIGGRVIIQFNNQTIVQSNEAPAHEPCCQGRVLRGSAGRGRTRETVVRDNGNQIVTIRNGNGDVTQRSRITPDGREYVLSYVDERYYQDVQDWRDPGDDLPPRCG